ncbi:MAG: 4-hydroxy-3-methylbut-2-enyl diphosphate reductase [Dissulfuribacterales bacterium]
MEIILANPRGFCAGVIRAIKTVRLTLEKYGAPVYVLHEIVHNKHVIQELRKQGAVFVENLADIPTRAVTIFSAHGVSRAVEKQATELGLRTIDATCPLVASVHRMVSKYHKEGYSVVIIGHRDHPEVEGTAGRINGHVHLISTVEEVRTMKVNDSSRMAYVTQTTLSHDDIVEVRKALENRFPDIKGPASNICYATQNRQNAVKELAGKTDVLFVVGSKNSSNSNRLKEVGMRQGIDCYLIDDAGDIDPGWLEGIQRVGVTAGASAPERLVDGVINWLRHHGATTVQEMVGKKEEVRFEPAGLDEELS